MTAHHRHSEDEEKTSSVRSIFLIFLRLGLTSFGGPVAHLGYFRTEFVTRRKWLDEHSYADMLSLCQFLPGPASSQLGMIIGYLRGGYGGTLAAWAGFTLPSALLMILFALGLTSFDDTIPSGVLNSLKIVAVAVVAQAVLGMMKTLCTGGLRLSIMVLAASIVLLAPHPFVPAGVIALSGMIGFLLFRPKTQTRKSPILLKRRTLTGLLWLTAFLSMAIGLPILSTLMNDSNIALIDIFFRTGSLVFGGGHVVLPLLQAELVPTGLIDNDIFLAGYGAAQALPGPLFAYSAYLGTAMTDSHYGWITGFTALIAIFAPSFFLIFAALPFWERLRHATYVKAALGGINAAVVGLLLAALYHPVWTGAIHRPQEFVLATLAFMALTVWKLPPWLVVAAGAMTGWMAGLSSR